MARSGLLRLAKGLVGPQKALEIFAQKPLNCGKLSVADRKIWRKIAKNDRQARSLAVFVGWQSFVVARFDHANSLARSIRANFPGTLSKV